jgi:uncharacterized protein
MRLIISGATGLIGSELTRQLTREGHHVTILVRSGKPANSSATAFVHWDIERDKIEQPSQLENHDAVIHLAGESVAKGRWTSEKKRLIRDSRVKATRLLVETLARLNRPPTSFLSASAIGFYGNDRGDEILTEDSAPGNEFLAGVCREWEAEALRVQDFGARVVQLRTGIVLSGKGGALGNLLPIFRMGLGGKLGNGCQWMSWISMADEVAAIRFALESSSVHGPLNLTAPAPVTNAEFTKTLAGVLSRPGFVLVPAFALRLALGEMAGIALGSLRVLPDKLHAAGYQFKNPDLQSALREL